MKKSFILTSSFLLLASLFAVVARADVKEEIRKATSAVRTYSRHATSDEIRAKASEGLRAYERFAGETNCVRELSDLASAVIRTARAANDFALARPFAERCVKGPVSPTAQMVAAKYLTTACVEEDDFTAAEAVYDKLLATGRLSTALWAEAWAAKADLKSLRNDYDGAVRTLEAAFKAAEGERGRPEIERFLQGHFGELQCKFHYPKKAFDYYLAHGRRLDALRLYDSGLLGDMNEASTLCRAMLTDEKATFNERLAGWTWLFNREPAFADAHFPLCADDNRSRTNAVIRALSDKLAGAKIYNLEGSQTHVAYYGRHAEVIRTWKAYEKLLPAVGEKPAFVPVQSAVVACLATGDRKSALAVIGGAVGNDKFSDAERYELALLKAVLPLTGSADEIAAAVGKIEPPLAGKLDADKRLARFDRVGSAAVMAFDETLARALKRYRDKVTPEPPKKSYVVKFSSVPVAGATGWENLPFKPEESAFDRPYGGEGAAFLATDVATGDRGSAVQGGEGRTTLQIVADAWGLHILRTFRDKRAREFEHGFLDAGSFEEYLAPGEGQPYACFIVHLKKGARLGGFQTAYDGEGRRRIDLRDPASIRTDVHFTDDAVLVYTGISWDNYPLLVPRDGMAWEYESAFWGPNTCTWNGLKTIHGRSSWGRLVFEMPEAARTDILKAQICKAAAAYRDEKKCTYYQEGVIAHWQDAELGDPAFYEARVKPLEAELDAVLKRIKTDMTAAEVKDIAEMHLEKLVDFRYLVDRLRTEWLHERL